MAWQMRGSDPELDLAMRRVPRWWLIPIVLILVVAGLGAAYWAGSNAAAGSTTAQDVPVTVPVFATVEKRAVAKQVSISGKVVAGEQKLVKAAPSPGVDRLVVNSTNKAVGDQVSPGEVIAVVSGRPLLVLPNDVPLYRDLALNDTGPDVTAFQKALAALGFAVTATGSFDSSTQAALSAWYEAAGSEAPTSGEDLEGAETGQKTVKDNSGRGGATGTVAMRWEEFVQIPGDAGKVASIAAAGSVLDEGGVAASVTIGEDTIVARADVLQAESFPVGAAVTVRAGTAAMTTDVRSVGSFAEGDSTKNEIPGKDITFHLPAGAENLTAEQSVTVTAGNAAAETLAVPLIAVRQEAGTSYVELETPSGVRRTEITVTSQADGWAALGEVQGLAVGDKIKVQ